MNGDIRPPKRPGTLPQPVSRPPVAPPSPHSQPTQPPVEHQMPATPKPGEMPPVEAEPAPAPKSPKPKRRLWPRLLAGLVVAAIVLLMASLAWYFYAQRPVEPNNTDKVEFVIESGMTPGQIGSLLEEEGLIRSQLIFTIYTRLNGIQGSLQAGQYRIAPSESLSGVVDQLLQGNDAQFTITFYPGATIYDPTDIADEKRTDVYTMLTRAGYSQAEVEAALEKDYSHPLFADKPAGTSLEGYVYGETYTFGDGASVEQVLIHTFDEFYKQIEDQDIISKAKQQGMTLYEAITLGSIIEREVSGLPEDQKQVSQVFHRRLDEGIMLGADATFMYAAQQRNVAPRVDIDSEYNTRKVAGLPPGPISTPDIIALEAAVNPAPGDYLFFVSGDDGRNHFSHTQAEHDANTRKYCTTLCQLP